MRRIILFLVSFLLCIQNILAQFHAFDCKLRVNPEDITEFIQMLPDGKPFYHKCPHNLVFKSEKCTCDIPDDCDKRPVPGNPRLFEQLSHRTWIDFTCAEGSAYDHSKCRCSIHLG